ncbi:hypothetical protein EVAR_90770_1 [Eumeta japonica]|uniref:Uncharacterized protein n=1 Tax=Eumeta variegata TaxID=151549 RepID=A0A4C1YIK2_EUMVA|nr:hypothetical protein EVAR_90770_1 [Eumeta japonica]
MKVTGCRLAMTGHGGDVPSVPPLKRSDNSIAINDTKIAECLADSIEYQCSHSSPSHDIPNIHCIEEEVWHKASLEPKDDLPLITVSEVQS